MRARVLAGLLACGAAALAASVAWVLHEDAGGPGGGGAAAVAPARGERAGSALDDGRHALDLLGAADADAAAGAGGAGARAPGVDLPPPDALRSVRGRVLDAQSGEPLAGIELSLLSRRPRTVRVTTDAHGQFLTARELASGIIAVQHRPAVTDARYAARWEAEPTEFLLPAAGEGAPPHTVELRLRPPLGVLEIDVRRPDGLPAAEASVALTGGRRDEHGVFVPEVRDFEVADAQGRARFALFGDEAWVRSYRAEAELAGTLVSEPVVIDPPLPTRPERVDLFPGAVVRVRVRNDEGRPVPGVSLWASAPESGRSATGHKGDTDANGEFVFSGLRAACWSVSAVHPLTGETVERSVDLERGEYADVDLRLSVAGLRLALQGTVLDENGYPLQDVRVHVQAPGAAPLELSTDPAGQFQFWSRPGPALIVGFGGAFLDDRFEPGVVSVPFGTTGVLVRRVERAEERSALFEVVDAQSGAACGRAWIWLGRPEPSALSGPFALQRWSAPSGVAQVAYLPREDTFYAVDAPGYLRAEGPLAAALEEAGAGHPLRIELARGFERRVEARDRITRAPVAGAVFATPHAVLATTDAAGAATLRAEGWPGSLRVECPGYAPLAWDPLAAGYPGTVVWLEPLRAR